jgi:argininosuccinate lyase
MIKKSTTVWATRFKQKTLSLFENSGASIDVDKRLYNEDIKASIVHTKMLSKQKIIPIRSAKKIIIGLKKIHKEIKNNKFNFQKKYEDIHLNIEKRLFKIIGDDAGYMHTARSRNDQVITDFKLWILKATEEIIREINFLIKTIINVANKNVDVIMPGFTHLKNAQPIYFSHYLLAYVEMFKRDKKRFINNLDNLYENPLGVAALSGTSYAIDRNYTTKNLGFKRPTKNSIDTISDRDFTLDFLSSSSICSLHISRISEELIIWNSDVFKMINLSDKVLTGSSIMPQKKNPDPLEMLRGKTGTVFGNLNAMLTILKGLPLSYFKDMQDDKEIVFNAFDNIKNCIKILNEVIKNIKPNKKRMMNLAGEGFTTATDFADYLVQKKKISFRKAYQLSAKLVNHAENKKKRLDQLKIDDIKKIKNDLGIEALKTLNIINSANSKRSFGGTSVYNVKKMLKKYKKEFNV